MAEFSSEIAADVLAACQAGANDAAGAFSRSLDREFSLEVGETSTLSADTTPDAWQGPGLVVTFQIGEAGALLLLPESSGLLPEWYGAPDDTGRSKLATLAQELSYVLLPQDFTPDNATAVRVKDLAGAFQRSNPPGQVACLALQLTSGDTTHEASLLWPVQSAGETADPPSSEDKVVESAGEPGQASIDSAEPAGQTSEPPQQPTSDHRPRIQYANIEDGIRQLPGYAKSLLKVRVPVKVTLASVKYPVSQILNLGHGSIIQFEKSCEDHLTLEVGDQPIAEGEAVKVGEKFGLWITAMTMPDERFWVIHGRQSGARVK